MAESQRKPRHVSSTEDEEAQTRKDRITLIVFGILAVLIVIGMILLAKFLSGN